MDLLGLGHAYSAGDPSPDTIDSGTYALAVFIACIISCLQSLGMGLQKRVHLDLAALAPDAPRLPYYKHKRWLAGLGSMTLASVMVIANYTLLGQARASAFAALSVVTNCVMAKYYLQENLTYFDGSAAALILSGVAVCAIFGASAGVGTVPLHDLVALLARPSVYAASALALAAVLGLSVFVERSNALGAARSRTLRSLECVARAFLGGIYSGSTGFCMKGVTSGVSSSFNKGTADAPNPYKGTVDDSMRYGFFYLFLLGLPLSLVFQLRTLNAGLKHFEAVEFVPIYQASLVVVGVAWGWVFYQENKDLEVNQVGLFVLGCVISVLGIAVLSLKPAAKDGKGGKGGGDAPAADDESAPLLGGVTSGSEAPGVALTERAVTLNPFGRPSTQETPLPSERRS